MDTLEDTVSRWSSKIVTPALETHITTYWCTPYTWQVIRETDPVAAFPANINSLSHRLTDNCFYFRETTNSDIYKYNVRTDILSLWTADGGDSETRCMAWNNDEDTLYGPISGTENGDGKFGVQEWDTTGILTHIQYYTHDLGSASYRFNGMDVNPDDDDNLWFIATKQGVGVTWCGNHLVRLNVDELKFETQISITADVLFQPRGLAITDDHFLVYAQPHRVWIIQKDQTVPFGYTSAPTGDIYTYMSCRDRISDALGFVTTDDTFLWARIGYSRTDEFVDVQPAVVAPYSTVTVGITSVEVSTKNPNRESISIHNTHANNIAYIGGDADVTTVNGRPLYPLCDMHIDGYIGPVYAIADGAGTVLRYEELR
jgi:hypothetical protein